MRHPALPLALLAAIPSSPAWADACATVKAAYDKLATAPAYRQSVAMEGTPPMQLVMIGDVLYITQDATKAGGWTKMPMAPGMRAQMMQQTVPDAAALTDCREVGPDTLDGAAMTVLEYRPPPIEGLDGGLQSIWIGEADGLPHRMKAVQDGKPIEVDLAFDGVTAPIP